MKAVRLNARTFPVSDHERALIAELGVDELCEVEGGSQAEIIEAGSDADLVMISSAKVRRDAIEKLEKCRVLVRYGTGTDNIDVEAATERGILVTNVPDFCIQEMAEHAMLLLLGAARKVLAMHDAVLNGRWISVRTQEALSIHRIAGKTLGLVGFGNAGQAVAVRAQAFGMKVIDYHRHVRPEVEARYGVTPVSFERVLRESDFIVLLCPLTPETENLIGERELQMMKKDCILINVARGGVVDETALGQALRSETIAGAGIDVFLHMNMFKEPEVEPSSPYFGLRNVLLSPHIAGTSAESFVESYTKALRDAKRILTGVWPINCVNPEVQPWFKIARQEQDEGQ
jgi:D-3-phosphoglycerate dehydrogenase / 2-oxoglutarate reductase